MVQFERAGADSAQVRLLVIYQHAPTPGAPGIYRHRMLLAELVRRGWDVDLVSSPINYMDGTVPERYAGKKYVREDIDGITHHWVHATDDIQRSFRRRARNYVTFAWNAALRGMRLPRPDIVWASSPPLSVASAGRWVARRHRVPLAFEVRDLWPESAAAVGLLSPTGAPYRLIDRFARTYAREADLAIVPTPGLVDLVRGHGADDVSLVTGAIEDRPPRADVRAAWRARLGVDDRACLFAYVGAHGVVNGLDVLFDALELVRGRGDGSPQVRVVTAGSGSATQALNARLAGRPIAGLDVLGPIPKDDARDLLAAADVGLHLLRPDPVFASTLPTKVLEYLGCHLPFVTTVPGLPGEVAAATGGDLAPDTEQLADALERWAQRSSGDRRVAGDTAFAWGESRYGLAASVDALEASLRTAVARGRRSRRGTGNT
ncbi:MAG: putative glycosyltransferase [Thermoleophilia bacterium]|nr:putative glycosyltransferase [Thermoleophilia bacterium]